MYAVFAAKTLKNISGSSQEETGGKDVTDRLGMTRNEEIFFSEMNIYEIFFQTFEGY